MKEIELKNIDGLQVFKILTIVIAICVLISGVIISLASLAVEGVGKFFTTLLGTLLLVVLLSPIYGLIAAVVAWLYNFVANLVGGLKITLNIEEK